MSHTEQLSESSNSDRIFSHSGISYKEKTREVTFSSEAKEELRKLIIELQEGIKVEEKNEPIGELTAEVGQAVVDAMISEWKWKQKVGKFMKRFSKAIEKPEKMSEKEEHKVTKKVEKFTHDPYIHLYIELEDGQILSVPLIIRKWKWIDHILHSFFARIKVAHSH
jgi:hypothetical protein